MNAKKANKFSPEVRARAVRMVLDHEREHPSRLAAISSIAAKIGCTAQTLNAWVKKAEVDGGARGGRRYALHPALPSDAGPDRDRGASASEPAAMRCNSNHRENFSRKACGTSIARTTAQQSA